MAESIIEIGSKYIYAMRRDKINNHVAYTIHNRKSGFVLGSVQWQPGWRCYVFQPEFETEYSPDCLQSIGRFLSCTTAFDKELVTNYCGGKNARR